MIYFKLYLLEFDHCQIVRVELFELQEQFVEQFELDLSLVVKLPDVVELIVGNMKPVKKFKNSCVNFLYKVYIRYGPSTKYECISQQILMICKEIEWKSH